MTDPARQDAVTAVELLSLKEAKRLLNGKWPALQLQRLRKFDQGRDVYRVLVRGMDLTFDAATPGKAIRDAMLYSESITRLTGTAQLQFVGRSNLDLSYRMQIKRALGKVSRHQCSA